MIGDDIEAAMNGDEQAQLRMVIRSLCNHIACILIFKTVPDSLRRSSLELAKSALDLIDGMQKEK